MWIRHVQLQKIAFTQGGAAGANVQQVVSRHHQVLHVTSTWTPPKKVVL